MKAGQTQLLIKNSWLLSTMSSRISYCSTVSFYAAVTIDISVVALAVEVFTVIVIVIV